MPNAHDGTVSVIDTAAKQVVATIPVGQGAHHVIVRPDGTYAFTDNRHEDSISVMEVAAQKVVTTIRTEKEPAHSAMTPDGRILLVGVGVGRINKL